MFISSSTDNAAPSEGRYQPGRCLCARVDPVEKHTFWPPRVPGTGGVLAVFYVIFVGFAFDEMYKVVQGAERTIALEELLCCAVLCAVQTPFGLHSSTCFGYFHLR